MSDSYERLLFAYPRRYRRERGRELVDMYRELTSDRGRPRAADAVDLIAGGLRERLRTVGLGGLAQALPTAALFSLTALSALSVYFVVAFELHPDTAQFVNKAPVASWYATAFAGWLVTAVLFAVAPARVARIGAAVSLALVIVGPVLRLVDAPVPDLKMFIPFPLAVVGAVAVALPATASRAARLAPIVAAAITAVAAVVQVPIPGAELWFGGGSMWDAGEGTYGVCCAYRLPATYALHLAGVGLLLAGVIAAVLGARSGRTRGGWTLLILATPVAALTSMWLSNVEPMLTWTSRVTGWDEYQSLVAGVLAMLVTAVLLPALISLRRFVRRRVIS
ncbi:hypothetical protein [Symbioplanes lichenis]|uniref:hypothetical protein n=1 Tax=Symbioplanes lichenis TaxID=1629072 RepID=UPI00273875AA|nr:hypothetical protein [Actinoplanes lichenis]